MKCEATREGENENRYNRIEKRREEKRREEKRREEKNREENDYIIIPQVE